MCSAKILQTSKNHEKEHHSINVCTVAEKVVNTPGTQALLKWGQFDRAKPIFKILLVSWTENVSVEEV